MSIIGSTIPLTSMYSMSVCDYGRKSSIVLCVIPYRLSTESSIFCAQNQFVCNIIYGQLLHRATQICDHRSGGLFSWTFSIKLGKLQENLVSSGHLWVISSVDVLQRIFWKLKSLSTGLNLSHSVFVIVLLNIVFTTIPHAIFLPLNEPSN